MAGFDWGEITSNLPYLFKVGMVFTLTLTGLAMAGGIVFGTILAMMRLSSWRIFSIVAGGYVNLMRSIPLVLVIFWFFFLVPYIAAWIVGSSQPIAIGAFWSAVITFTMFEAAPKKSVAEITYTSEVSWKRMIVCVSSTGSMFRNACGNTTCPIVCQ